MDRYLQTRWRTVSTPDAVNFLVKIVSNVPRSVFQQFSQFAKEYAEIVTAEQIKNATQAFVKSTDEDISSSNAASHSTTTPKRVMHKPAASCRTTVVRRTIAKTKKSMKKAQK